MPNEKIIKYYLLCTARIGVKKHIVNDLTGNINSIITNKDFGNFLRIHDGVYIAKDKVVGGDEKNTIYESNMILTGGDEMLPMDIPPVGEIIIV